MLIKNRKRFWTGLLFGLSFLVVLMLIFSPVFNGKNGLQFADASFNMLAKGSSYFIPKVAKEVEPFTGKLFSATVKLEKADDAARTAKLFTQAGATVEIKQSTLKLGGDLGVVLKSALKDSDAMYKNNGKAVSERYGYDEMKVMKDWWLALSAIEKGMKKEKNIEGAKAVSEVNKKAIEPAYNFYKIDAQKVSEHAVLLTGLLLFYVLYTMWWGYGIFYTFEGVGLNMKKSKIKKEV
ncbi:MAG: hypothetical protein HQL09_10345 [Nitrospirae bacterium]|nr:hypothetical protein [Nitrospirota bacterium]